MLVHEVRPFRRSRLLSHPIFGVGDELLDEDADRLDIPIHAFDLVIADGCHRGYTAAEESVWRSTLDHFDAIKIGLTATPAAHTTSYFDNLVYRYDYSQAVRDGYLVDYGVVTVHPTSGCMACSSVGGSMLRSWTPSRGSRPWTSLRTSDSSIREIEEKVTAPDSNRKIIDEVKRYALRYGRVPKTLIFAVNDLPHTSRSPKKESASS